jgi:hypothetical protein
LGLAVAEELGEALEVGDGLELWDCDVLGEGLDVEPTEPDGVGLPAIEGKERLLGPAG